MRRLARIRPSCAAVRETLSALLDGEEGLVDEAALDAHLGSCASCRAAGRGLDDLARRWRLGRLGEVPDLSGPILARTTALSQWRLPRLVWLLSGTAVRWSGVAMLAAALPAVGLGALGHAGVPPAHTLSPCVELLHRLGRP